MVEAEIVPTTGNLCLEPPPTTQCRAGPSREPLRLGSQKVGIEIEGLRGFQAYDADGQAHWLIPGQAASDRSDYGRE
jgi:hypothetical protein